MLLVIDVGNSNTVLGLYEGDVLRGDWRVVTTNYRTGDELRILFSMLLTSGGFDIKAVTGCCVSSVVPQLNAALAQVSRDAFGVEALMVGPGVKTGLVLQCDNPKEVGSDRIMNTVAAVHLYGGPAIVVDFGTSTNFDAASAKGEFVGGALAPGIEISVDALTRRAAQLLKVELTRPHHIIGKNTVEALQSGIIFGFAGQVEGIARRMAAELAPDDPDSVTVIATGGPVM